MRANLIQLVVSIDFIQFTCCPFFAIGCWAVDRYKRPTFKQILEELNAIVVSSFTRTPNESFHTMQAGWKKEIDEVLQDLRLKEKVRPPVFIARIAHSMSIHALGTRAIFCSFYENIRRSP